MRFIFICLLFTFSYVNFDGLPLYAILLAILLVIDSKSIYRTLITNKSLRKIVIAFFIYTLGVTISYLIAGNIYNAINQILLYNILIIFSGIYIFNIALTDKKQKLISYVLIIFLANAVVSIIQSTGNSLAWDISENIAAFFGTPLFFDFEYYKFQYLGRVRGLFLYVHKFSPAIMAVAGFFLYRYINNGFNLTKILLLLLLFYSAFLTYTRSIIIGFVLGYLISFIIDGRLIFKIRYLFFAIIVFSVIYFTQFEFLRFTIDTSQSDGYRVNSIIQGLDSFSKNIIFGNSLLNNTYNYTIHSVPIRILADSGLVGFLLYVNLLYITVREIIDKIEEKYISSFIMVLMIFLVDNFSHSSGLFFYDIFQFCFLMFLFGTYYKKKYD